MLRLLGRVGLLAIVACVIYPFDGFAEIVSVDDPRLIAIREHIMKAYYLRPEPVDQCTEKQHRAANKLYTRVVSQTEQEDMLQDMESSMWNSTDDFFTGLDETQAALASTKIKYMLYWERKYINSATYRNPLTGRTITMHQDFSPASSINGNYTDPDTGCQYELVNCYPFPKWLAKYYRNYVPTLTRLQHDVVLYSRRNQFIKMSGGIGGKFTEVIKFASNPWLHDLYLKGSIRTTVLLRGYEKKPASGNSSDSDDDLDEDDFTCYGLKSVSSRKSVSAALFWVVLTMCALQKF